MEGEDEEDEYGLEMVKAGDKSKINETADDDQWFSDSSSSSANASEEKEPRLVMYCQYTQYDVVKETGKVTFNYHLTRNEQKDWDIAWFDGPISIKLL